MNVDERKTMISSSDCMCGNDVFHNGCLQALYMLCFLPASRSLRAVADPLHPDVHRESQQYFCFDGNGVIVIYD